LWRFAREPHPSWWHTAATGAIAGGAIGNLLDRVRLGYVVDFIAIGPWPNFNVADSAITMGALLLCWGWLRTNVSGDTNPAG
jgi:signal peptidase II